MATHSSILAWRIPGMGEPGGLWGRTELDTTEAYVESNKYNKPVNKTRSRLIDMENKLVVVSGERVGGGTTSG